MPANPQAESLMAVHWDRLKRDIRHPFTRNPLGRNRLGISDLSHAITNIPVEFCRVDAYAAGHLWLYQTIGTVVVLGAAAATLAAL